MYEAEQVVRKLRSADPAALKQATFLLRNQLTDEAFRSAFIGLEGVPALQAIIRRGGGNTLAYALASLHVLLDAGDLAFDSLFVARLIDIVGEWCQADTHFEMRKGGPPLDSVCDADRQS